MLRSPRNLNFQKTGIRIDVVFKKFLRVFFQLINQLLFFSNNDKKLVVLYQSVNYLIVYKDFDVFTNNEVNGQRSLHTEVASVYPHLVNKKLRYSFYFPHRLDYATSGIICLALNKTACAAASKSFQNGKVVKYYLALLRGHLSVNLMDIQTPIGENFTENCYKMCTAKDKSCASARHARTLILVLERGIFSDYPATKVLIRPVSGRRHQIRVHCSSVGHTIVGDYTYSNKKDVRPNRTYLHAFRLLLRSSLESMDIHTDDPFDSSHLGSQWINVETANLINGKTFLKLIDHCDINNKISIY